MNNENELNRYQYPDEYTLLEIKWIIENEDLETIQDILKKLYKNTYEIDDQILKLIFDSKNQKLQKWMIDNVGSLDQNEIKKLLQKNNFYLQNYCYEKHRSVIRSSFYKFDKFIKDSQIKRLAIIRGPGVNFDIVEKLFDYNSEAKLSINERTELIRAYITNKYEMRRGKSAFYEGADAYDIAFSLNDKEKLWKLISQWPSKHDKLKSLVYKYVENQRENKIEIYKKSSIDLKYSILLNCDFKNKRDNKILNLAKKENDDDLRYLAYSKIDPTEDIINKILEKKDTSSILGICKNDNVPTDIRWDTLSKLRDIDPDIDTFDIEHELGKKELEEDKKTKPIKIKHKWDVFLHTIELLIIMGVLYSLYYTNEETIIVSLLVIIYLSIKSFFIKYSEISGTSILLNHAELSKINTNRTEEDKREYEDALLHLEKTKKQNQVSALFIMIAYIFTVLQILGAILS